MAWRDDLLALHLDGWDAGDIDDACEALHSACTDGVYDGLDIHELTDEQVRSVLTVNVERRLLRCIRTVAALRGQSSADADELRRALYDLDAFAYEFAGDG